MILRAHTEILHNITSFCERVYDQLFPGDCLFLCGYKADSWEQPKGNKAHLFYTFTLSSSFYALRAFNPRTTIVKSIWIWLLYAWTSFLLKCTYCVVLVWSVLLSWISFILMNSAWSSSLLLGLFPAPWASGWIGPVGKVNIHFIRNLEKTYSKYIKIEVALKNILYQTV